jgi:uncharacterized SAM-binding protein YcdF (DUF218 family)
MRILDWGERRKTITVWAVIIFALVGLAVSPISCSGDAK